MRCLVLVLAVLVLALLAASSAGAAKPPNLKVVAGTVHRTEDHLEGRFVVANAGTTRSRPVHAILGVGNGRRFRAVQTTTLLRLSPEERHTVRVAIRAPRRLPAGAWRIEACVPGSCRQVGQFHVSRATEQATQAGSDVGMGSGAAPTAPPSPSFNTVPADPIPHPVAEPFFHAGDGAEYWGFIPRSYDATNQTATTLFVWLHGCGGEAEGDAWVVDPGADEEIEQDWMTLSLGGRDGGCWNPLAETEPVVMTAIADFETHFNVNRGRVILGGYSSGGDLAYRTAFKHSSAFAGLLIENSAPFRDTEASEAELLGAATTKFPIVHLAHAQDTTYKLDEVEPEIAAVRAAGFPVELIVRPGGHSDSHTNADLLTYLLPHIDDGRLAPQPEPRAPLFI
jgi:predicted esterase